MGDDDIEQDIPPHPWRVAVLVCIRVFAVVALLLTAYYVLPLDRSLDGSVLLTLVLALVALVGLAVLETRAILHASMPGLKAVEALATLVPLLILVFAGTYFLMSASDSSRFTEALTRTDALYFTVTVFSTVGFGDITAASQGARAVVVFQMAVNLVVVGLGLRVILDAAKRGREKR